MCCSGRSRIINTLGETDFVEKIIESLKSVEGDQGRLDMVYIRSWL